MPEPNYFKFGTATLQLKERNHLPSCCLAIWKAAGPNRVKKQLFNIHNLFSTSCVQENVPSQVCKGEPRLLISGGRSNCDITIANTSLTDWGGWMCLVTDDINFSTSRYVVLFSYIVCRPSTLFHLGTCILHTLVCRLYTHLIVCNIYALTQLIVCNIYALIYLIVCYIYALTVLSSLFVIYTHLFISLFVIYTHLFISLFVMYIYALTYLSHCLFYIRTYLRVEYLIVCYIYALTYLIVCHP